MKARYRFMQIARLIVRLKSTLFLSLRCTAGSPDFSPKQTTELASERAEQSRNACGVAIGFKEQYSTLLRLQWNPA